MNADRSGAAALKVPRVLSLAGVLFLGWWGFFVSPRVVETLRIEGFTKRVSEVRVLYGAPFVKVNGEIRSELERKDPKGAVFVTHHWSTIFAIPLCLGLSLYAVRVWFFAGPGRGESAGPTGTSEGD